MRGHRLCDSLFFEAVKAAFQELSPEEQEVIDALMKALIEKIPKLGPYGAMEVLAKFGIFDLQQRVELNKLLLQIEKYDRKGEKCEPSPSQITMA